MNAIPPDLKLQLLLRSFLLQAAWNYRTLQGAGAAFVLLPLLRRVHTDPEALEMAVARHSGHFNAHPYLASLALGSLARLEAQGTDPDTIRRFRAALGGPLGALGDRLVWAAWLPLCAVVSLSLLWAGLAPGWVLLIFLAVYNVGHVGLRIWGFEEGWAAGQGLGQRLRTMGLANLVIRLEGWLAGAMGFLVGLALLAPAARGDLPGAWAFAGVLVLGLGAGLGPRLWRPTAAVTVAAIGLVLLSGFFF
ncbi:MAG TPA: PTS system mannose/fructose/sorbose family transporter subunit IID [Longimicrobiales bacterium]|nr:PTS system mannose/fructose/sorbose family transporter subunit IID [Longimicrobiales bacterium]